MRVDGLPKAVGRIGARRLILRQGIALLLLAAVSLGIAWGLRRETTEAGTSPPSLRAGTEAMTASFAAGPDRLGAAAPAPAPATESSATAAHYGPINTSFPGLTMFRGNAARTYYGEGPVPARPRLLWKFGPMWGESSEGPLSDPGKTVIWQGTGWTGQPAVFERQGRTWVVFGAYDHRIHFLDAATGRRMLPDFVGGDLFKGSVTVDPDGYPLVYMGCRDNYWRVIAFDRPQPTELWRLDAHDTAPVMWNDDWDGNALIHDDHAFVPGENGHLYAVRLYRGWDAAGRVKVAPRVVLDYPGWTDKQLRALGAPEVSIEDSPALMGDRLFFANSGGLVQGLDVSAVRPGELSPSVPAVFSFWDGDDTDASIVVDDEGFLYVAVELQRSLPRAQEVGQILKLDPRRSGPGQDPVVWSVAATEKGPDGLAGVWATPALHRDMLYVPTHGGELLGIERATGTVRWRKPFPPHAWASPVVVDDTLLVGDREGVLHAYDVSDTGREPPERWAFRVSPGALESTPAVWKGVIYLGSRDGYFYALGDTPAEETTGSAGTAPAG